MDSPTRQKAQEISHDLENWMSNLPTQLRSMSLIHLAIPGSHDSMTWSITRKSSMSPDAEPLLQRLRFLGSMLGYVMSRWSITQGLDVTTQLNAGVRYFDLRIATRRGTDELYFVHGLYADDVRGPLADIQSFLETSNSRGLCSMSCCSHDSMTWSITRKSSMSPDAEPLLQRLRFLGSMLGYVMSRWSITQGLDVTTQLNAGVRYFDLRIATRRGTDELYFVHGLYADDVRGPLADIQSFLETHPREVVILDCQHFYAFGPSDHERFMRLLTSTFGHKLLPYTQHMDHITLEFMTTQFRYQVIVIYRSDAARFGQPLLWPAASWPTPWPDTVSISKLFTTLEENLKSRSPSKGYVSQCVLTPSTWFVCKHLFGTLRSECGVPLEKHKLSWLEKQKPGGSGVNIVISDFIGMSEMQFCKAVVGLNAKLLAENASPT